MNTIKNPDKKVKIEFGFGAGLNRYGEPISPETARDRLTVIRVEAVARYGGYTITATIGGWRNPAGTLAEEGGYTLMVLADDFDRIQAEFFASFIGGALCQEAVAITVTPVTSYIHTTPGRGSR